MGLCNLKHQLGATVDPGGWAASGVVASCKHHEGRLAAGRLREMAVVPFPGVLVVIKAATLCEEQQALPHSSR